MYDTVWIKDAKGEDVDLQFKCGENICQDYNVGDAIQLANGIYFCYGGAFVVSESKIVAAFHEESNFMFNKWGGVIQPPNIDDQHPFAALIKKDG